MAKGVLVLRSTEFRNRDSLGGRRSITESLSIKSFLRGKTS